MAAHQPESSALLRVENLKVHFAAHGGIFTPSCRVLRAVDGVSFEVPRAKTLGLVGESGCGKSTLARAILRLIPATAGKVYFDARDVFALPPRALRPLRRRVQIVFQDPVGSLNPRLRVETIVGEALTVHGVVKSARDRRERVTQLLLRVGLSPEDLQRYPHEFSGGQRQRIGIARALALAPSLIICDEPVSALDVSIQAQILNLLADLQHDLGLGYLFIAHNLGVVRHISDEVAVMYLGRIVEQAPTDKSFRDPRRPYTRALLAAAPDLDLIRATTGEAEWAARPLSMLGGESPSPLDPPPGCAFQPRCPLAEQQCREKAPQLQAHANLPAAHRVACHLAQRSGIAQKPPAGR